ncbi:YwhD family protein [Marinicrinis sediminis]|uniref:YwhD family protein n=1 Tax=Marinicrinis sediminis TaxID=1652465 RepID=A0ABW5RFH4_9BACL
MDKQDKQPAKKKLSLNIVSNKKEHKGFGAGSVDLSQVSSIIIDGPDAYVDLGAMHAKSKVERGIKFSTDLSEVPNGRTCWIVWVAVDRTEEGTYYAGLTASEMKIDTEARRGWKVLANHVNLMDKAMKRKYVLNGLSEEERAALKAALIKNNQEMWERSPEELKSQLETETQ